MGKTNNKITLVQFHKGKALHLFSILLFLGVHNFVFQAILPLHW